MAKKNTYLSIKIIIIYILIFFSWWSIYELSDLTFSTNPLLQELITESIKLFTWFFPAVYLLKKYSSSVNIPLEKIFINKFKIAPYLLTALLLIGFILLGEWLENGKLLVTSSFHPVDLIGTFLFVGITEEIVFRGWLQNALTTKIGFVKSMLLTSILFVFIHFPIWIRMGILSEIVTSGSFVTVFILSVIFTTAFEKSRNILVPIALHMIWDLTLLFF